MSKFTKSEQAYYLLRKLLCQTLLKVHLIPDPEAQIRQVHRFMGYYVPNSCWILSSKAQNIANLIATETLWVNSRQVIHNLFQRILKYLSNPIIHSMWLNFSDILGKYASHTIIRLVLCTCSSWRRIIV